MLEAPDSITIDEKDYKYEGFTLEVQSAFEKYMHAYLIKELQSSREALGEDYLPLLEQHVRKQKRGWLNFGSTAFLDFCQETDHFVQLLWFVLAKLQPIMAKEVVVKWVTEHSEEAVEFFHKLYSTKKN